MECFNLLVSLKILIISDAKPRARSVDRSCLVEWCDKIYSNKYSTPSHPPLQLRNNADMLKYVVKQKVQQQKLSQRVPRKECTYLHSQVWILLSKRLKT